MSRDGDAFYAVLSTAMLLIAVGIWAYVELQKVEALKGFDPREIKSVEKESK